MVRLPRTVWIQLAILGAVTVIACGVMAFGFVNVPALLGIGRYNVTLDLPASGGLYPSSVVTYRGSEIGRVTSIDVTHDGVRAVLKLDSSTKVPSDVSAAVHSRSAVGEQFVELTPQSGTNDDTAAPLRDGDVIPVGRTQIPPDIGGLLDATNTSAAGDPAGQSAHRRRRSGQGRRRTGSGTVPHRRRIDVAGDRGGQEQGLDHCS